MYYTIQSNHSEQAVGIMHVAIRKMQTRNARASSTNDSTAPSLPNNMLLSPHAVHSLSMHEGTFFFSWLRCVG